MISVAVCGNPVKINNQFYEFLEAGIGPQPQTSCYNSNCGTVELLDRGIVPTSVDVATTNQKLRVYLSDSRDVGKRILICGTDENGRVIRNIDGIVDVEGEYITLDSPFADSVAVFTSITGVQKDYTYGDVLVYSVDQNTGATVLLSLYAPDETVPQYRRYYVANIPENCCNLIPGSPVQVEGMVKLDHIPVQRDSDFLTIGCFPAIKAECESIRYSEMDNQEALNMSILKHKQAIKYLNDELTHRLGKYRPAISQNQWGTAKLDRQSVGSLI